MPLTYIFVTLLCMSEEREGLIDRMRATGRAESEGEIDTYTADSREGGRQGGRGSEREGGRRRGRGESE